VQHVGLDADIGQPKSLEVPKELAARVAVRLGALGTVARRERYLRRGSLFADDPNK
jgi:hypothetical protein